MPFFLRSRKIPVPIQNSKQLSNTSQVHDPTSSRAFCWIACCQHKKSCTRYVWENYKLLSFQASPKISYQKLPIRDFRFHAADAFWIFQVGTIKVSLQPPGGQQVAINPHRTGCSPQSKNAPLEVGHSAPYTQPSSTVLALDQSNNHNSQAELALLGRLNQAALFRIQPFNLKTVEKQLY